MLKRVIPILLLEHENLVKTKKFKDPKYIGDPINAIKIFNEKLVDEILVMDILATSKGSPIQYGLLREMAGECFMPLCYGGGVRDITSIRKILQAGIERVAITTALHTDPTFVREAIKIFGSSTIVAGIDYKKDIIGRNRVYISSGNEKTSKDPVSFAGELAEIGVGEILLHNIEREGTYGGYDLDMLEKVLKKADIPVMILGGAKDLDDIKAAFTLGAGGAVAGNLFVFRGNRDAILINYPKYEEIAEITG